MIMITVLTRCIPGCVSS